MPLSVHDNILLSYKASQNDKSVLLETADPHSDPQEHTNLLFSEVLIYRFEDDNLDMGTILFDVAGVPIEDMVESNWTSFQERYNCGWPGFWAKSKTEDIEFLLSNSYKAYEISSSCGLPGWVIAKDYRKFSPTNDTSAAHP